QSETILKASANPQDTALAKIDSITVYGNNVLNLYFSKPMDLASVMNTFNYRLKPANTIPASVLPDATSNKKWQLLFSDSFSIRKWYTLELANISDAEGYMMHDTSVRFFRYISKRNDILFHEIMADPEPSTGLPDLEWVELINASPFPVNLGGWRLGKTNSRSGPLPHFILMPDSLLLVCSSGSVSQLSAYGNCRSVTYFPSLSNSGDQLILSDQKGKIIHTVSYMDQWHENQVKKAGGWTLEMRDIKNPCTGLENWSSSNSSVGGTPGKHNSIEGENPDYEPPILNRGYVSDPQTICLVFNETIDSTIAIDKLKYSFEDTNLHITGVTFPKANHEVLQLTVNQSLDSGKIYAIQYDELKDCVGNPTGTSDPVLLGVKKLSDSLDLVVNEVLFNPKTGGSDMVELYNRSKHVIDLEDCYLAHLDELGAVDNITRISEKPFPLLPQEYIALTTDKLALIREYPSCNPNRIEEIVQMPSYGDDEGNVILLNLQGKELDRLHYMDEWHFPLLEETEGISLERLDVDGKTQNAQNWHSASGSSGFATPGQKNSQSVPYEVGQRSLLLKPKWISPNNDGKDDLLMLEYTFDAPGNVLQAFIYDARGAMVKRWLRTALCGRRGMFYWDGMLDTGKRVGYGAYVLYVEYFNGNGEVRKWKQTFFVGG
ncbi:MAG: hypothetical protein RL582_1805, partial [Bacteroidota bacterium]